MLRGIFASLTVLALAACGTTPNQRYGRFMEPVANPSKVVATELAFARAAQENGQWTAFAEYSTGDAVMFVPEPVNAHDWLSGRENPAEAVQWQPHQVWSSCDGSLAVAKGAWQRADGTAGYFTTIWERQSNGEYKWVLDQGDMLEEPLAQPEFVQTTVAECEGQSRDAAISPGDGTIGTGDGSSNDDTLKYWWRVDADRSRSVSVKIWTGSEMKTVLRSMVAASE